MTSKRTARQQTCRFWDCTERVRQFMCGEHYRSYKKGEIDACPSCKRFKLAKYDTCMDCRKGSGKAAPKAQGGTGGAKRGSKRYRREHSDAWASGDAEASEFYVYILKLEDGSFYAGQTREIRERLMEHRDGMTKSTAGKDPKLVWFTDCYHERAGHRLRGAGQASL